MICNDLAITFNIIFVMRTNDVIAKLRCTRCSLTQRSLLSKDFTYIKAGGKLCCEVNNSKAEYAFSRLGKVSSDYEYMQEHSSRPVDFSMTGGYRVAI